MSNSIVFSIALGLGLAPVILAGQGDTLFVTVLGGGRGAGQILEFTPGGSAAGSIFASGLGAPEGLVIDPSGNLYVADTGYPTYGIGVIYKFTPDGTKTVFASSLHMWNTPKFVRIACAFLALCGAARGDVTYNVSLDTAPLIGHPAGPFYFEAAFTDGNGFGDSNNTATISSVAFGGGGALGSPIVFGGATGSLETGVTITDSSFLSIFSEQFTPGRQLSFQLGLTSNDDSSGVPDGFTFYILDSSGVPLPTKAPAGDYFLTAALHSSGPVFNVYGSDPSRSPSVGNPVSIPAPVATPVSSTTPEPRTAWLTGLAAAIWLSAKTARERNRRDKPACSRG